MMLEADIGEVTEREARQIRNRLTDVIFAALNDEPEEFQYVVQTPEVIDVH